MLTDAAYYHWDETSSDWVKMGKNTHYYSEYNISAVPEINEIEINVYPNPCSKNVSFSIPGNDNKTVLELFDIQGRKVLSKEIRNNEMVSLEGLNTRYVFL